MTKQFQNNEKTKGVVAYFFSFKGTLGRADFLGVMVFVSLLLRLCMQQNIIIYDIVYLLVFCSMLAATQKRCRDINWQGTFFILLYSITFPFFNYYQYMKSNDILISESLKNILAVLISMYFLSYAILILVPGKKEQDKNIQSCLLKYPYIYIGLFFVLFLIGQYIFIGY